MIMSYSMEFPLREFRHHLRGQTVYARVHMFIDRWRRDRHKRKDRQADRQSAFIPVLAACVSRRHAHRGVPLDAAASLSQQLFCVFPHPHWPRRAARQIYFDVRLRLRWMPLATVRVRAPRLAARAGCQGFGASFTILRL